MARADGVQRMREELFPPPEMPAAGPGPLRPPPRLVSIVCPAFNESGNLPSLHAAIAATLGEQPFELILVDDGSTDETGRCLETLARSDPRVHGIRFARNFGQQAALLAGLLYARGDVLITMDADLQHPPDVIPQLLLRWRQGARLVHTRRVDDAVAPLHRRLTSRLYYRVFSALSGVPIEPGMADFRLLDRCVVEEIVRMRDRRLFLRGAIHWMGHRSAVVEFTPNERYAGQTKYTLRRMLRLAWDGIMSFSTAPLRIGLMLGIVTSLLAFVELAFVVVAWALGKTVPGWASILGVMSLMFGVLLLIVGIQGQYLLRLYEQSVFRPPFVVESVISHGTPREAAPVGPPPPATV